MPLPINISDLINQRVVENARVEYKGDWNPNQSCIRFVLLQMTLITGAVGISSLGLMKKTGCQSSQFVDWKKALSTVLIKNFCKNVI